MPLFRFLVLLAAFSLPGCVTTRLQEDRASIAALVQAQNERVVGAWHARDASRIFPGDAVAVVTPEGREITAAQLRADLQRRMDMTRSIEEMSVEVADITVNGNEAVAISNQRFVRTVDLGNGALRQRISTVTHRQRFRRMNGSWTVAGPIEESNQRARWADEPET